MKKQNKGNFTLGVLNTFINIPHIVFHIFNIVEKGMLKT